MPQGTASKPHPARLTLHPPPGLTEPGAIAEGPTEASAAAPPEGPRHRPQPRCPPGGPAARFWVPRAQTAPPTVRPSPRRAAGQGEARGPATPRAGPCPTSPAPRGPPRGNRHLLPSGSGVSPGRSPCHPSAGSLTGWPAWCSPRRDREKDREQKRDRDRQRGRRPSSACGATPAPGTRSSSTIDCRLGGHRACSLRRPPRRSAPAPLARPGPNQLGPGRLPATPPRRAFQAGAGRRPPLPGRARGRRLGPPATVERRAGPAWDVLLIDTVDFFNLFFLILLFWGGFFFFRCVLRRSRLTGAQLGTARPWSRRAAPGPGC